MGEVILERLAFTQLLWEVAGSLMWAEVGLWKAERSSPGLGREACWIVGRTGYPGKWGGGVCSGAMKRVNSEKMQLGLSNVPSG